MNAYVKVRLQKSLELLNKSNHLSAYEVQHPELVLKAQEIIRILNNLLNQRNSLLIDDLRTAVFRYFELYGDPNPSVYMDSAIIQTTDTINDDLVFSLKAGQEYPFTTLMAYVDSEVISLLAEIENEFQRIINASSEITKNNQLVTLLEKTVTSIGAVEFVIIHPDIIVFYNRLVLVLKRLSSIFTIKKYNQIGLEEAIKSFFIQRNHLIQTLVDDRLVLNTNLSMLVSLVYGMPDEVEEFISLLKNENVDLLMSLMATVTCYTTQIDKFNQLP